MSSILRSTTVRAGQAASGSSTMILRAASTSSSTRPPRTPKRRKNATRRQPRSIETTRALVNLHHTAASFMHSPDEITTGFENSFRHSALNPYFQKFWQFRESALEAVEARGSGSEGSLVERVEIGAKSSASKARASQRKAATYSQIFKKHENLWSERGRVDEQNPELTEREIQVKEALFGTWERGGLGMRRPEPSLDGIQEYLSAKGVTLNQAAQEWSKRHEED
ncbi:hypothetical protein BCR39DRAFT_530456 [Naematelia encephala]|uniref:Uncharacterized protein n=1 Tax=Naematelia encephala TaxID=71784 RepID=A0A1Y2B5L9_9TREE|nr:hypothetical protein BCR39DRAFT_530456 [Naematelia encephala]